MSASQRIYSKWNTLKKILPALPPIYSLLNGIVGDHNGHMVHTFPLRFPKEMLSRRPFFCVERFVVRQQESEATHL